MLLHVSLCIGFRPMRLFENAFRLDSQLIKFCLIIYGSAGIAGFLVDLGHDREGRSTLERMLVCIRSKLRRALTITRRCLSCDEEQNNHTKHKLNLSIPEPDRSITTLRNAILHLENRSTGCLLFTES